MISQSTQRKDAYLAANPDFKWHNSEKSQNVAKKAAKDHSSKTKVKPGQAHCSQTEGKAGKAQSGQTEGKPGQAHCSQTEGKAGKAHSGQTEEKPGQVHSSQTEGKPGKAHSSQTEGQSGQVCRSKTEMKAGQAKRNKTDGTFVVKKTTDDLGDRCLDQAQLTDSRVNSQILMAEQENQTLPASFLPPETSLPMSVQRVFPAEAHTGASTYTHPVMGTYTHPVMGTYTHPVMGTYTHPVMGTYTQPVMGTYTQPVTMFSALLLVAEVLLKELYHEESAQRGVPFSFVQPSPKTRDNQTLLQLSPEFVGGRHRPKQPPKKRAWSSTEKGDDSSAITSYSEDVPEHNLLTQEPCSDISYTDVKARTLVVPRRKLSSSTESPASLCSFRAEAEQSTIFSQNWDDSQLSTQKSDLCDWTYVKSLPLFDLNSISRTPRSALTYEPEKHQSVPDTCLADMPTMLFVQDSSAINHPLAYQNYFQQHRQPVISDKKFGYTCTENLAPGASLTCVANNNSPDLKFDLSGGGDQLRHPTQKSSLSELKPNNGVFQSLSAGEKPFSVCPSSNTRTAPASSLSKGRLISLLSANTASDRLASVASEAHNYGHKTLQKIENIAPSFDRQSYSFKQTDSGIQGEQFILPHKSHFVNENSLIYKRPDKPIESESLALDLSMRLAQNGSEGKLKKKWENRMLVETKQEDVGHCQWAVSCDSNDVTGQFEMNNVKHEDHRQNMSLLCVRDSELSHQTDKIKMKQEASVLPIEQTPVLVQSHSLLNAKTSQSPSFSSGNLSHYSKLRQQLSQSLPLVNPEPLSLQSPSTDPKMKAEEEPSDSYVNQGSLSSGHEQCIDSLDKGTVAIGGKLLTEDPGNKNEFNKTATVMSENESKQGLVLAGLIKGCVDGLQADLVDYKMMTASSLVEKAVREFCDSSQRKDASDFTRKSENVTQFDDLPVNVSEASHMTTEADSSNQTVLDISGDISRRNERSRQQASTCANGEDSVQCQRTPVAAGSSKETYTEDKTPVIQPVRKSGRANRGQKYQELIKEGFIQPSRDRLASRSGEKPANNLGNAEVCLVDPPVPARTPRLTQRKSGHSDSDDDNSLQRPRCDDSQSVAHLKGSNNPRATTRHKSAPPKIQLGKSSNQISLTSRTLPELKEDVLGLDCPAGHKRDQVSDQISGSQRRKARRHSIMRVPVLREANDDLQTSGSTDTSDQEHKKRRLSSELQISHEVSSSSWNTATPRPQLTGRSSVTDIKEEVDSAGMCVLPDWRLRQSSCGQNQTGDSWQEADACALPASDVRVGENSCMVNSTPVMSSTPFKSTRPIVTSKPILSSAPSMNSLSIASTRPVMTSTPIMNSAPMSSTFMPGSTSFMNSLSIRGTRPLVSSTPIRIPLTNSGSALNISVSGIVPVASSTPVISSASVMESVSVQFIMPVASSTPVVLSKMKTQPAESSILSDSRESQQEDSFSSDEEFPHKLVICSKEEINREPGHGTSAVESTQLCTKKTRTLKETVAEENKVPMCTAVRLQLDVASVSSCVEDSTNRDDEEEGTSLMSHVKSILEGTYTLTERFPSLRPAPKTRKTSLNMSVLSGSSDNSGYTGLFPDDSRQSSCDYTIMDASTTTALLASESAMSLPVIEICQSRKKSALENGSLMTAFSGTVKPDLTGLLSVSANIAQCHKNPARSQFTSGHTMTSDMPADRLSSSAFCSIANNFSSAYSSTSTVISLASPLVNFAVNGSSPVLENVSASMIGSSHLPESPTVAVVQS